MQEILETRIWSLGWEDPIEEGMAAHSSVLAQRIPWTEKPGRLWSIRSQRDRHNWSDFTCMHLFKTLPRYGHIRGKGFRKLIWVKRKWKCCSFVSDSLRPRGLSPPCSSVRGILQARILEWVAILFSRGSSWSRDGTQVSCTVGKFFTVWATRKPINLMGGRGLPNSVHSRVSLRRHSLMAKENETRFTFHRFLKFNHWFFWRAPLTLSSFWWELPSYLVSLWALVQGVQIPGPISITEVSPLIGIIF